MNKCSDEPPNVAATIADDLIDTQVRGGYVFRNIFPTTGNVAAHKVYTRTIVAMTVILVLIWGGFYVFIRLAMDREKVKRKMPEPEPGSRSHEPDRT